MKTLAIQASNKMELARKIALSCPLHENGFAIRRKLGQGTWLVQYDKVHIAGFLSVGKLAKELGLVEFLKCRACEQFPVLTVAKVEEEGDGEI